MEPISLVLLAALAGGAGGEAGRQAWASLSALVRRPFRSGGTDTGQEPPGRTGLPELLAVEEQPHDSQRASALSTALAVRAALDPGFRAELEEWHRRARAGVESSGSVHNRISGGTQHGPVLQGQNFSDITFTTAPPPASTPEGGEPPRA
ncbi:hypothetical protein [Peterkaempfera bronchialis]|uniref:hypothetical protein n=1 Tax=Peterkaempfera bronchialis TaxID=2126346 RepID=UPI003C2AD1A0